MTTFQQTYINALLAEASYANDLRDGDTGPLLVGRLSTSMTLTLAKFIGDGNRGQVLTISPWHSPQY